MILKSALNKSDGFTLVEIAMVLIIIGLITSSLSMVAMIQLKSKTLTTTRDNLMQSELALRSYLEMNGHYPCPAGRQVRKGGKLFGRSVDACLTVDDKFFNMTKKDENIITAAGRNGNFVKIGILPFRSLSLPDSKAIDGWGRLLQYAVTEKLTDAGQFDQKAGAIDVLAEDGQSRVVPKGSVQYIIFSTGEDGKGGYSADGVPLEPCPQNVLETENCNNDAVFMDAPLQYTNLRGPDSIVRQVVNDDDLISYQQFDPAPNAKGGILFFYYKSCPDNFAELDVEGHDMLNIVTLNKDPSFGSQSGVATDEKLCFSSRYSLTMTLLSENGTPAKGCPPGWTGLGYRLYSSNQNLMHSGPSDAQVGSVNNLVCAR